jgi:transcriptional regulator with XRE-family HTH domain
VNPRQRSLHEPSPAAAKHNGTALGRLLQDRRESAGYSRARVGELVNLSPGTIEGWEVGRVRNPAVYDVLRLAHFLQIPFEDVQRAVFTARGDVATIDDFPAQPSRVASPFVVFERGEVSSVVGLPPSVRRAGRRRRARSARHT